MNNPRVIAAMSGGVDSSVAAAILAEQGRSVVGVTMKIWSDPAAAPGRGGCCSLDDADDARRVCHSLGIPHYTVNASEVFRESVVEYFTSQYYSGRTPNPCIPCNHALKFDLLFQKGAAFGASIVATGHYAGIGDIDGFRTITRAVDQEKDQSYYLFSISPDKLGAIEFPLASFVKGETRRLAEKFNLPVAHKQESQEICFVPDDDYKAFMRSLPGARRVPSGDIVNVKGETLGHHTGYIDYTVGQRRGLGISSKAPLYVLSVDPDSNRIVVGGKEELYASALAASGANWFVPPEVFAGLALTAKIRSRSPGAPAQVTIGKGGQFTVEFSQPQLSVTPGQAVVIYHGDHVVGGGWIDSKL